MNHWWRAYNEAVNDPKLQLISDSLFRAWFNLMCVASANDGNLPPLKDIAFTLRMAPTKAAQVLAQLHAAGLLDKTDTGFVPHNWNGRQYKSDKVDETAAERMARYRERKRNGRNASVTVTAPREQNTDTEDRIGDARETPSSFTEGSKALASSLWKALGFENVLQIPPEYAGVDWRALEWERAGWTADLIDAETRRIGPGKPLTYYEKVFATAFAKRQTPLPTVEIRESQKITVTRHGTSAPKSNSLIDHIDRRLAELEAETGADLALPEDSVLCLSHGPVR
jgi:hypothetical protein